MRKKLTTTLLALTMVLALLTSVSAIAPLWDSARICNPPVLKFSGSTAICIQEVEAEKGATISGTLTLYESGMEVMSWPVSGTAKVSVEKRWAVLPGHNYTLTVNVTVSGPSGTDHIVLSTSRDCP